MLLTSGSGFAFDCAGVKLPSTLVICSDPELMRLADERQEAFSAAMARLDPQRQKELLADQKGWVRSYATACGAPPNAPAPSPVSDAIKAYFKRAAQARVAYIRAYGLAGAAPRTAASKESTTAQSSAATIAAEPSSRYDCWWHDTVTKRIIYVCGPSSPQEPAAADQKAEDDPSVLIRKYPEQDDICRGSYPNKHCGNCVRMWRAVLISAPSMEPELDFERRTISAFPKWPSYSVLSVS